MEIQAGDRRNPNQSSRENLPVGHHDYDIRTQKTELIESLWIANLRRLKNRHVVFNRELLNRRRGEFLVATDRFVRLGDTRKDLMILRLNKAAQRGEPNVPRTDEDDPHDAPLKNPNLTIVAQGRSLACALRKLFGDGVRGGHFALTDGRAANFAGVLVKFPVRKDEK